MGPNQAVLGMNVIADCWEELLSKINLNLGPTELGKEGNHVLWTGNASMLHPVKIIGRPQPGLPAAPPSPTNF